MLLHLYSVSLVVIVYLSTVSYHNLRGPLKSNKRREEAAIVFISFKIREESIEWET